MAKSQAAASGKTKVRILVNCHAGRCGDVLETTASAAAELVAGGFADSNSDAVAYAESIREGTP